MEENNEKKKHPRRRYYRGKNGDRPKDREKQKDQEAGAKNEASEKGADKGNTQGRAGGGERQERQERSDQRNRRDKGERQKHDRGEKRDRAERHDRDEKHDKADRQEKGRKRDDRKPQKKEHTAEPVSEEKYDRPKREPEEIIFEFTWADAWGLYGVGYHIVIKDNPDRLYLSWSVDLSYGEMKLGQRLKEFLEDMKRIGLGSWDGRKYSKTGIFDGDTWALKINSLVLKCEAQGTNEYPNEWKELLKCLHEKWSIPVSRREQWE